MPTHLGFYNTKYQCVPQTLTGALVNDSRLCSFAWRGQPVNTFSLSTRSDAFPKSLESGTECPMTGIFPKGFQIPLKCVILPLELYIHIITVMYNTIHKLQRNHMMIL